MDWHPAVSRLRWCWQYVVEFVLRADRPRTISMGDFRIARRIDAADLFVLSVTES